MKIPSDVQLVGLIAGVVASACVVAVVALAVREKRRTGQYPHEIVGGSNTGWFSLVWVLWMIARSEMPLRWLNTLPVSIMVLGIDLALLIAFAALGAYSLAHVFRPDWDRRWGLHIVASLLFPALSVGFVIQDAKRVASAPWVWIPGVLIAVSLTPYCARWAYEEFYLRRMPDRHGTANR